MTEREELEAVIETAVNEALDVAGQTGGFPPFREKIATALLSSGYTKGNGELVEAVRQAVADLDGGFFRCKACGHQHDEIGTELDPVDDLRKALSDSEGVATSGGDDWQPIETAQDTQRAANGDHHDE